MLELQLLVNTKIKLFASSVAFHIYSSETSVLFGGAWLGKARPAAWPLTASSCWAAPAWSELLGTDKPLQNPTGNQQGSDLCLFNKGGKKCILTFWDAGPPSHMKRETNSSILSVFLEMFSSRSLHTQRHLTSFCLFKEICQTLYKCPQHYYLIVTLCNKYPHLFMWAGTIASNHACSFTAVSPGIKWPEVSKPRCLKVTALQDSSWHF